MRASLFSKSLFAGVAVLFLAPMSAGALPRDCDVQCTPTSSCRLLCAVGSSVINCGEYGVCVGATLQVAPSEPQASVQPDSTGDADLVCREPAGRARG